MNELHKKVLQLLGYGVIGDTISVSPTGGFALFNQYTDIVTLDNGFAFNDRAEAWAIAPSIEDLRSVLESALDVRFREFAPDSYGVVVWKSRRDDVWIAEPPAVPLKYHGIKGTGDTPSHAVMSLFVAACEAGLIDPKQVG